MGVATYHEPTSCSHKTARLSSASVKAPRENTSDFELTTLHVYSIIGKQTDKRRSGCATLQIVDFPCSNDNLFFLLTSCSHLPAYEPALSKESIESNHVNTPSKSSLRSHFCTYFLELFLQKNRYKFSQNCSKRVTDQHFIHTFGLSSD